MSAAELSARDGAVLDRLREHALSRYVEPEEHGLNPRSVLPFTAVLEAELAVSHTRSRAPEGGPWRHAALSRLHAPEGQIPEQGLTLAVLLRLGFLPPAEDWLTAFHPVPGRGTRVNVRQRIEP